MSPDQHVVEGIFPVNYPVFPDRPISEEEFLAICGDARAEWVDGEVIPMSPVSNVHDDLNNWLSRVLGLFVEWHDLGVVKGPEFAVRLGAQRRRRVPDLFFLDNDRRHQLKSNHLEGAPNLVIEIVSPESRDRDWNEKPGEYEAAGVRELWVIDPEDLKAEFYMLAATSKLDVHKYESLPILKGAVASSILPGLTIPIAWFWPDARPKALEAARKLGILS